MVRSVLLLARRTDLGRAWRGLKADPTPHHGSARRDFYFSAAVRTMPALVPLPHRKAGVMSQRSTRRTRFPHVVEPGGRLRPHPSHQTQNARSGVVWRRAAGRRSVPDEPDVEMNPIAAVLPDQAQALQAAT